MKPDLVYDEPMHTGPVRIEVYGDTAAGLHYVQRARRQLGGMRCYYGVNERIAQGEAGGFYHRWGYAPDGTRIHTITNSGQDTIRIYPVTEEESQKVPKKRPVAEDIDQVVACGWVSGGDGSHGAVWFGINAEPVDVGNLNDGGAVEATMVADDGDVVIGICWKVFMGGGDSKGFRWTRKDGIEDIGQLSGVGFVRATGVSADGGMIVGTAYEDGIKAFVWTRADGMQALPDEGIGVDGTSRILCSPSGNYIVGVIYTALEERQTLRGVYWEKNGGSWSVHRMPEAQTHSMQPYEEAPGPIETHVPLIEFADYNRPCNVSDAGIVQGSTFHREAGTWIALHEAVAPFGAGHEDDVYAYFENGLFTNSIFRFDIVHGEYSLYGIDGTASGAADDDETIVGNSVTNDYELVKVESDPDGSYFTSYELTNRRVRAWYTDHAGQVQLDIDAVPNDITEDASIIVGIVIDVNTPCAWLNDQRVDMAMGDGNSQGNAVSVTRALIKDISQYDVPA